MAQIRARWPKVTVVLRGDSGFVRDEIMAWCEQNRIDFVFGLAKNDRLKAEIADDMMRVQEEFERTGQPARIFREFRYKR